MGKTFILLFIILPIVVFSQKSNKSEIPTISLDSVVYDITPKTLAPSDIFLPFKSIEVMEARFDTSKLGYELDKKYETVSNKDFKQIKLMNGVQKIPAFFLQ